MRPPGHLTNLDAKAEGERPSMSRGKTRKGGSKVKVGEAASRVEVPVYHTGQGQDERARTRPPHLLRGLDSAWSIGSNPHRESGTRWRAAADVDRQGPPRERLMVGRKDATGTDWATPLGHTLPALARDLAALRAPRGARRGGVAWTQAACGLGA